MVFHVDGVTVHKSNLPSCGGRRAAISEPPPFQQQEHQQQRRPMLIGARLRDEIVAKSLAKPEDGSGTEGEPLLVKGIHAEIISLR